MKTETEMENCLESFKRRHENELNPETKKMWNVMRIFTEFVLDRRGHMYYPGYEVEVDVDSLPPLRNREAS